MIPDTFPPPGPLLEVDIDIIVIISNVDPITRAALGAIGVESLPPVLIPVLLLPVRCVDIQGASLDLLAPILEPRIWLITVGTCLPRPQVYGKEFPLAGGNPGNPAVLYVRAPEPDV